MSDLCLYCSPQYVLVVGGNTVPLDWAGRRVVTVPPVPSSHLHLYDFDSNSWTSTAGGEDNNMTRNQIPRVNHACAKYQEDGKIKIIIAGGVILDSEGQYRATQTTEVLDFESLTWSRGTDLPRVLTGAKFIEVSGRPTIVGRSHSEPQKWHH